MQELNMVEVGAVGGGISDFTTGGIAVICLGLAGTVATGGFGLVVGAAMLYVGQYQK